MNSNPSHQGVCFFWHEMALFICPSLESIPHRHFGIELTLALDGDLDVNLRDGSRVERLGGALFNSNVMHQHRLHGSMMAQLVVGPLTASGLALRASLGARPWAPIRREQIEPFVPQLRRLIGCQDPAQAHRVALALVNHFAPKVRVAVPHGEVLRAMNRLLGNFADNIPVNTFARESGLSESRFCHLFRSAVGVPVRTYRRWLRLRAAVVFGLSGWELSDAAQEAGFADQADFTRACRLAFGVPPSLITRHPISVFVEEVRRDSALMSARNNPRAIGFVP